MKMAVSTPSVFLLLSILLLCQGSHLPDHSDPSSVPEGHRHHHQHHRHHHHQSAEHRSSSEHSSRFPAPEIAHSHKVEEVEVRESEEESVSEEVKETPLPRGGRKGQDIPDSKALGNVSAQEGPDDQLEELESPHHPDRPGKPSHQPDHDEQGDGPLKEQQPNPHLPTAPLTKSPQLVSRNSTTTPSPTASRQRSVSEHQGNAQSANNADPDEDKTNDNDNASKEDSLRETPAHSSDEKLGNRPRLRHIFRKHDESQSNDTLGVVKDKRPRNLPRNNQDIPPEVEVNSEAQSQSKPDSLSGLPVDENPGPGRWSNNRPRFDLPAHSSNNKGSSSQPNPVKQKENAEVNVGVRKDEKKYSQEVKEMKQKKKKEEDQKKPKKNKRQKSGKKSGPHVKGCPGCTQSETKHAEARELHKQVLKAQLLDKLRLTPTFQRQPWPPKLPKQVFSEVAQDDQADYQDQYYATPTQLLLFGKDLGPRHRLKKSRTGSYQFEVRSKVKGEVGSARLWVYKMRDANDVHEQTLVVTELRKTKRGRLRERSLVARHDTRVREGWVSFDVTHLVRRWIEKETPASLQLLAIRCKTCHRASYRAIFGVKSHFRPVLVIRESGQEHRQRRSACDPNTSCCKFDMTVTFEELGIHEIFRPLYIKADYCFGFCDRPDSYYYNHTMIMQHMRFNSHFNNATLRERLRPCCVPVVLREATIYHYINPELESEVNLVPNLLVDRCGCA